MMIHLGSVSNGVIQKREVTCSKSVAPCVSGFGGQRGCGNANTTRIIAMSVTLIFLDAASRSDFFCPGHILLIPKIFGCK